MTKVLVLWEDAYHGALDRCVRRALQHLGGGAVELYFDDVRGNGGFAPYLASDWPIAATRGLPKSRGPIDHLLCVADADRAHQCCGGPAASTVAAPTQPWVEEANRRWTEALRTATAAGAERVWGRFLRWNQESLLIALHDIDEAMRALGITVMRGVQTYLRGCDPSPLTIAPDRFVDAYRKPQRCFEELLKAAGARPIRKGAPALDDAIDAASRRAIDKLCARVPDLGDLAGVVRELAVASR
ncbi:MAG: hypothetical protein IT372_38920 [Polyangiaceae bacterium]|nr:hypothetical protein [Polyangiaceae bacterium]